MRLALESSLAIMLVWERTIQYGHPKLDHTRDTLDKTILLDTTKMTLAILPNICSDAANTFFLLC